jgi:hypothetical protein
VSNIAWIGRPGQFDPELLERWERVKPEVPEDFRPCAAVWCPFCLPTKRIVIASASDGSGSGTQGAFHEKPGCFEWRREPDAFAFIQAAGRKIGELATLAALRQS